MRRFVVAAVAATLFFVAAPPAFAKSFTLERLDVQATVNPDASMDVVERVTYRFDGSFSRATRTIPPGRYEIQNLRVTEGGRPLSVEGTPDDFAWTFAAADEDRTFEIAYRVAGAVQVGPDVGELYWKWIGTEHPGVRSMAVDVRVPATEGVRAWGHGPLNGVVAIDGGAVQFTVDSLPAETFVEGRIAIPSAAFTAPKTGEPRLPTILAEEKVEAERANEERRKAADRERRIRQAAEILAPAAIAAAVLGWVGYIAIWRKWGREPDPPADVGEYFRDVPEEPPGVVDGVLGFGTVGPTAFAATLVDLAQRGFLDIREEREDRLIRSDKVDWIFTRKKPDDETLRPHERMLLDRVFAAGDTGSQSAIIEWAKDHPTAAQSFWESFKEAITDQVKAGYIEGGRGKPFALNILVALGVAAVGVASFVLNLMAEPITWWRVIASFIVIDIAVVQAVATRALRRRTALGARRAAEFRGLKEFLRDFSSLDEAPIGSMAIWERYLVYAVALGVSAELVRGLALRVPEVAQSSSFAPWYVGGSIGGDGRLGSIGSFGPSFADSTVSAFSPPSSSSGSGGGFSGGGGGGGGGGGFGAS